MKSKAYQFDLVEVIWDDAEMDGLGWEKPPEKLGERLAISVGFKIRMTTKHILICSTIDAIDQTNGRFQIPRGMVKRITTLRKATLPVQSTVTTT